MTTAPAIPAASLLATASPPLAASTASGDRSAIPAESAGAPQPDFATVIGAIGDGEAGSSDVVAPAKPRRGGADPDIALAAMQAMPVPIAVPVLGSVAVARPASAALSPTIDETLAPALSALRIAALATPVIAPEVAADAAPEPAMTDGPTTVIRDDATPGGAMGAVDREATTDRLTAPASDAAPPNLPAVDAPSPRRDAARPPRREAPVTGLATRGDSVADGAADPAVTPSPAEDSPKTEMTDTAFRDAAKAQTPAHVERSDGRPRVARSETVVPGQPIEPRPVARDRGERRPAHRETAAPAPTGSPIPAEAIAASSPGPRADVPATKAPAALPQSSASSASLAATGADRHLEVARAAAWIDGIARDIAMTSGAEGSARFTVSPANLGTVHVALSRDGDRADVAITAASADTAAMLARSTDRLVEEARAHGLEIRHATVESGAAKTHDHEARRAAATDPQPARQPDAPTTTSLTDRGYGGGVGTGDTPGRRPQQPQADHRAARSRPVVRSTAGGAATRDDGLYA